LEYEYFLLIFIVSLVTLFWLYSECIHTLNLHFNILHLNPIQERQLIASVAVKWCGYIIIKVGTWFYCLNSLAITLLKMIIIWHYLINAVCILTSVQFLFHQLQVRDDEGRRRFHGAFTGGYSAGYYNTVGSKEGISSLGNHNHGVSELNFKAGRVLTLWMNVQGGHPSHLNHPGRTEQKSKSRIYWIF